MYTMTTYPQTQRAVIEFKGKTVFIGDIQKACVFCEQKQIKTVKSVTILK